MSELDESAVGDLSKFFEHFPVDGDLTLQVLKGHLILEEIMREIFKMQLRQPSALVGNKGASYDCHQIICLVESMTPASQTNPWIWSSTKKLNNIRNDLAHQLTPKGLKDKVADLIKYVKDNNPEFDKLKKEGGLPKENELFIAIISMCAGLSAIKSALKPYVPKNA